VEKLYLKGAVSKPQSERSQPRSGDIFIEQRSPRIAAPEERHIVSPINGLRTLRILRLYKYFVPNGTQDRFPFASISFNV
jgi:hypothetical protein